MSIAADSCIKLELYEDALKYVERVMQLKNDQDPLKLLGRAVLAAYKTHDSEKALIYAQKALDIAAETGKPDSEIAGILDMANNAAYKLKKFDQALGYAERYLQANTFTRKNPRATTIAAFSSYECEKYEATVAYCLDALKNDANNKAILALLCNGYRKIGDTLKFEETKNRLIRMGGKYFPREPGDNFLEN